MSEERGAGLATDDTDATDIHRLPCASVICANRCYLCPLWANLHVYFVVSGICIILTDFRFVVWQGLEQRLKGSGIDLGSSLIIPLRALRLPIVSRNEVCDPPAPA